MVLVKYVGDIYPTRVRAKGNVFNIDNTGDVIDVPEDVLEHLLVNKNFKKAGGEKPSKKEKKEKKEKKVDDKSDDLKEEIVVDDYVSGVDEE